MFWPVLWGGGSTSRSWVYRTGAMRVSENTLLLGLSVNTGKRNGAELSCLESRPQTEGLLAGAGGMLCRPRGSRLVASDAPTTTVAPHQDGHDERPHPQENKAH